jgi:hypothetical protein
VMSLSTVEDQRAKKRMQKLHSHHQELAMWMVMFFFFF